MPNPSGPDQPDDEVDETPADVAADTDRTASEAATEVLPPPDPEHEPATEVISQAQAHTEQAPVSQPAERRYTAPSGFDAGSTQKIDTPTDPATEVFSPPPPPHPASPGSSCAV